MKIYKTRILIALDVIPLESGNPVGIIVDSFVKQAMTECIFEEETILNFLE